MPPKRASSTLAASNLGASSSKARAASLAGKAAAAKSSSSSAKRTSSTGTSASAASRAASPEKQALQQASTKEEQQAAEHAAQLHVDDPAWDDVWETEKQRAGMGKGMLVHASNETRIDSLLRAFDLDPRYGPALGLTRLERWTRAQNLGDEPPLEIKCILETKQGRLNMRDSRLAGMGV